MLWASTRVGLLTFSMTLAIVKVLPEPVTPSRVCSSRPRFTPLARASIASGWSPEGLNSETNSKRSMVCLLSVLKVHAGMEQSRLGQRHEIIFRYHDVVRQGDLHQR